MLDNEMHIRNPSKNIVVHTSSGKTYGLFVGRDGSISMKLFEDTSKVDEPCNHVWSTTTASVNGSQILVCVNCQKISYE